MPKTNLRELFDDLPLARARGKVTISTPEGPLSPDFMVPGKNVVLVFVRKGETAGELAAAWLAVGYRCLPLTTETTREEVEGFLEG